MKDFIEQREDAAEKQYYDSLQPDGRMKCCCGKIFDPDSEGGFPSPDPWGMPICGDCMEEFFKSHGM